MKKDERGRFITFEGADYSGKSTQARRLTETISALGIDVMLTREPGGSPWAEMFRRTLLSDEHDIDLRSETLLHFAARADHVAKTIRPALEVGTWVVSDRFYDSTMAYQGYAKGDDRAAIMAMTELVRVRPDLTIIFDISAPEAERRMLARGGPPDHYEKLGEDFQKHVRSAFRAIAANNTKRCVLIDADGDEDAVHARVLAVVEGRFKLRLSEVA